MVYLEDYGAGTTDCVYVVDCALVGTFGGKTDCACGKTYCVCEMIYYALHVAERGYDACEKDYVACESCFGGLGCDAWICSCSCGDEKDFDDLGYDGERRFDLCFSNDSSLLPLAPAGS